MFIKYEAEVSSRVGGGERGVVVLQTVSILRSKETTINDFNEMSTTHIKDISELQK